MRTAPTAPRTRSSDGRKRRIQGGAFLRVYDPAELYRRREELVLAFLDWSTGASAPKDVTDALCRWVQKLRQDARRKALGAGRSDDLALDALTPRPTG